MGEEKAGSVELNPTTEMRKAALKEGWLLQGWSRAGLQGWGLLSCGFVTTFLTGLAAVIKSSEKELKKQGFIPVHGMRVQCIPGREVWRQDSSHPQPGSTDSRRYAQLAGFFHSIFDLSPRDGTTHLRVDLPTLVTLNLVNPHRHAEICFP